MAAGGAVYTSKFAESLKDLDQPKMASNPEGPKRGATHPGLVHPDGQSGDFNFLNGDGEAPVRHMYAERRTQSFTSSMSGRLTDMRGSSQLLLGPRRPRPHKIWKKKFIKVLVVGDSGLGKTTIIKTLLSTPGDRLQVHDGTYTPSEQFHKDPESLCSTVTWKDEEDRVIWVYRVQDTPGYGDELNIMNNINMMVGFINRQNQKWLELENAKDRSQDLTEVEDPRVDIVIYCIPPHRLRPIDIRYMYELGKSVPIIPVIMKADTMTIREANNYRQEVFNRLQNPNIPGIRGKINIFKFEKETLERAGISEAGTTSIPPFLVVASNDINEEMNLQDTPVFWPERRYPWGTAEAFNPEHSDLLYLRSLLLKEALEEIAKNKRQRYEVWRKQELGGLKLMPKLRRFLLFTIAPVAVGVYAGRNGVSFQDIAGAAKAVKKRLSRKNKEVAVREPEPEPEPEPEVVPARPKRNWF